MKRLILLGITAIVVCCFNSCATITGTQNYTARVFVEDSPNAAIIVDNNVKGYGFTEFQWKRAYADRLTITVVEEGYKKETFNYNRNSFRTLAFLGNLIIGDLPGMVIDLLTGAVYEPDETENIKKISTRIFEYRIRYNRESLISKNDSQNCDNDNN